MKLDLLNDDTYTLTDDNGVEVEKGSVLPEWRETAKRSRKGLRSVIAEAKKVKAEKPLAVQVDGETVIVVPEHEHPYDDRYAAEGHEHDLTKHDHPHTHDEYVMFKAAIEQESQFRVQADKALEAKYSAHMHPELAQAFHTHEDIYASLNVLRGMVAAVEGLIPKDVPAHQHNDVHEAISTLRSEVTSLRNLIPGLESRFTESLAKFAANVTEQIENAAPKGDYATREELQSLTKRKGEFVELSRQSVNGRNRITLEEV